MWYDCSWDKIFSILRFDFWLGTQYASCYNLLIITIRMDSNILSTLNDAEIVAILYQLNKKNL